MSIVTTYLEMHSPDQLRPKRCTDRRFNIQEKIERDWRFNRDLYLAVGQMWSWNDKRVWSDEQWKEYGLAPELRTFAAYYEHTLAGYYELRQADGGAVEIAYFGLLPEVIVRGLGCALFISAIDQTWAASPSANHSWVHTSALVHPAVVDNYE